MRRPWPRRYRPARAVLDAARPPEVRTSAPPAAPCPPGTARTGRTTRPGRSAVMRRRWPKSVVVSMTRRRRIRGRFPDCRRSRRSAEGRDGAGRRTSRRHLRSTVPRAPSTPPARSRRSPSVVPRPPRTPRGRQCGPTRRTARCPWSRRCRPVANAAPPLTISQHVDEGLDVVDDGRLCRTARPPSGRVACCAALPGAPRSSSTGRSLHRRCRHRRRAALDVEAGAAALQGAPSSAGLHRRHRWLALHPLPSMRGTRP